jgi:hypothetical protein
VTAPERGRDDHATLDPEASPAAAHARNYPEAESGEAQNPKNWMSVHHQEGARCRQGDEASEQGSKQ